MSWMQDAAKTLYKRSSPRGDGPFVLVSKCQAHWAVVLFPDRVSRAMKLNGWKQYGCCPGCLDDHFVRDLEQHAFSFNATPERRVSTLVENTTAAPCVEMR